MGADAGVADSNGDGNGSAGDGHGLPGSIIIGVETASCAGAFDAGARPVSPTMGADCRTNATSPIRKAPAANPASATSTVEIAPDCRRTATDPLPIAQLPQSSRLSGKTVCDAETGQDRKSTRLNSSHSQISYAVFCLKKKKHCRCTQPHRG